MLCSNTHRSRSTDDSSGDDTSGNLDQRGAEEMTSIFSSMKTVLRCYTLYTIHYTLQYYINDTYGTTGVAAEDSSAMK